MRGLGTDHVISGPMRGLKKTASDGGNRQTETQTNIATLEMNRPSGAVKTWGGEQLVKLQQLEVLVTSVFPSCSFEQRVI